MAKTQFYLIRHGQTEWSVSGQHTGRTEIPLTATGVEEARKLAPLLKDVHFDRVLVSPRQRAIATCGYAGLGDRAEIEPDLAEWDYGDYEGKLSSEIHEVNPGWNIFEHGCPGGETPAQVSDRADRFFARYENAGTVALFSHGHFGSSLVTRWIGADIAIGEHLWLATASLSVLGPHPSHGHVRVLSRFNVGAD